MSNGLPVPYFGILGQEITAAMAQKGMPKGIYISAVSYTHLTLPTNREV